MKAMRLMFGMLLVLALTSRVDAAGFAMNDNFTVFTPAYPTQQDAEAYAHEVLQSAEAWRSEIAKQWLGEELPPGAGQTTVNVSFSEEQDSGLTWAKDNPRRKYHTLYLTTTPDRALGSTLAHEMVHVVLATRFPHPERLAAWIEEGIASTYDDRPRQATRQRTLSWIAKTGNWPDVEELLNSPNIATRDKTAYATASSLAAFLLTRGDKPTLLEFGQYANKAGWDAALSKYYRINSTADLQRSWQQWVQQSPAEP
jgi:hypothetical protein